jgi:hypothetical protein
MKENKWSKRVWKKGGFCYKYECNGYFNQAAWQYTHSEYNPNAFHWCFTILLGELPYYQFLPDQIYPYVLGWCITLTISNTGVKVILLKQMQNSVTFLGKTLQWFLMVFFVLTSTSCPLAYWAWGLLASFLFVIPQARLAHSHLRISVLAVPRYPND